jgi:hypothetical protein
MAAIVRVLPIASLHATALRVCRSLLALGLPIQPLRRTQDARFAEIASGLSHRLKATT